MRSAIALVVLSLLFAGCTGDGQESGTPTPEAGGGGASGVITVEPTPPRPESVPSTVEISRFAFAPASLRVGAGSTVRWTNLDAAPHNVRSDEGAWISPRLDEGDAFEQAFLTKGTFGYQCLLHPNMRGTIVVGDGDATQPPAGGPTPPPATPAPSPTPSPTPKATPTPKPMPTASPTPKATPQPSSTPPQPNPNSTSANGNTTPTPTQNTQGGAPTPVAVGIFDGLFNPASVSVPSGTRVTWTNRDDGRHTVTAQDGSFGSARLTGGQTFSYTFSTPGTHRYICALHPEMQGSVTVT